ncbi:MAG: prepilin-type N-terminal cleavage/methylation domain-containing protein [Armatimonadetes bacterium]|nr:prepilin-type N-terminal cleavage/methylation domain-containing protein [Armatimonadota bacterium]
MKRRGFTMIELMMTVALSAMVIGVMAGMYGFTSTRLADAYTKAVLVDQTTDVADRIEASFRNATVCIEQDGGNAVQCLMPANGVDTDGDGHLDTYYPDDNNADGTGAYSAGNYVWFFMAGASSTYKSGSGFLWRAEKSNSSDPSLGDIDRTFSHYYNTRLRYPLVKSVTFTVDMAEHTVTFKVVGTTRLSEESTTNATEDGTIRTMTVKRKVRWRNG